MLIKEVIRELESRAPLSLQESYDNAGLLTGNPEWACSGVLCTLDVTEAVIEEAVQRGCNLVVAHHPIIFSGLKKITGRNYVEKTIIASLKKEVAIYAIHTNLDNILDGVNDRIADRIGLINRQILLPKAGQLMKLYTFAPIADAAKIRNALFTAGAGNIGEYSEASFNTEGTGTFKGSDKTNPYVGQPGKRHEEKECKIEVIFPVYAKNKVILALLGAHPYEEVAYDIVALNNDYQSVGSGLLGDLPEALEASGFLHMIKTAFDLSCDPAYRIFG